MADDLFSSILDEAPTEVSYPAELPDGIWILTVRGWEAVVSSKKGTDGIQFNFAVAAPGQEFDPEDDLSDFIGKSVSHTFWFSDYFAANLDQFHERCGLDLSEPMSRRNRNDEVINAQVAAVFKQKPNQAGDRMRAEIVKFLPVD
jgi:hypothetical protein